MQIIYNTVKGFMNNLSNHSKSSLKTIILPQGCTEIIVLFVSLIYYGLIFLFYLQNKSELVLPEMLGYDTSVHMVLEHKLINLERLFSWDIRHPLINIMFLPPIIGDYLLSFIGYNYKWEIFTLYSCMISSYSGLVLFKILMILSSKETALLLLCLFFSFAHSILLSIQIDSFVLSLLFLMFLLLLFLNNYYNIYFNNILFFAITGTTSTNVIKFILYIFIICKKNIQTSLRQILKSSILFILLFLFTIPDLLHRLFVQHLGLKYSLLAQTLDYQGSSQGKLRLFFDNYISEPLLFHSQEKLIYLSDTSHLQAYPSLFFYIPIIIIVGGVICSIITNNNKKVITLIVSFLCVDIFIHVILGYGITEGQIFCAHWFFFIPILLALLEGEKIIIKYRLVYRLIILFITIFFLYHNLNCYIHGF